MQLPDGASMERTSDVVDRVLQAMGPVRISGAGRDELIAYMDRRNSGTVPFDLADEEHVDRKVRGLLGLVLTLPEAHLG